VVEISGAFEEPLQGRLDGVEEEEEVAEASQEDV
jgi:hypothetical protein